MMDFAEESEASEEFSLDESPESEIRLDDGFR